MADQDKTVIFPLLFLCVLFLFSLMVLPARGMRRGHARMQPADRGRSGRRRRQERAHACALLCPASARSSSDEA